MSNAAQPGKRPGRQFRPALAHSHEVPPHVSPAERQHHEPRLHLRHGFVARVAIDLQDPRSLWAEMRLRHLVAAAGIEQIDHRVRAENDPQPPTMALFPVQKHENQPTGFVGLVEVALPIALSERLVDRLHHRLDPLQAIVDRACRQVQIVLFELPQQPFRGPIRRILVQQDMHPDRDAVVAFGNQLRRWRGRKRSSRGITIARRPIPSPPNPPTMRPHVDLQQL